MTVATVAAVLTVLGYSMYDTIIIFDRIRENMTLMKRASFRVLGNVSLWETIPRSLATTFITLVPIVSLLLFGGDTLKDFAFALLIGIGAGAYSSIFVAAPMLAMFKEREPEYATPARRRGRGRRVGRRRAARTGRGGARRPRGGACHRLRREAGRADPGRRAAAVRRPVGEARAAQAAPDRPAARPRSLKNRHPSMGA